MEQYRKSSSWEGFLSKFLSNQDVLIMKLLGNSVLGYFWDAKNDIMGVKLKVNLSKKKRKIAKYPDLTIKDLDKLNTIKLTKRNLLGVLAGTFD